MKSDGHLKPVKHIINHYHHHTSLHSVAQLKLRNTICL